MKYVTPRRFLMLVARVLVGLVLLITRITGDRTTNEVPVTTGPVTGGVPIGPESSAPASPVEEEHDDSTADGSPLLVQPTKEPDAKEAATAFAAAWLNTSSRNADTWRAGLTDRITPVLAEELALADPKSVPAGCRTGEVVLSKQGSLVDAEAPVVTNEAKPKPVGTLILTLLQDGGRWVVSEIDWEPAR